MARRDVEDGEWGNKVSNENVMAICFLKRENRRTRLVHSRFHYKITYRWENRKLRDKREELTEWQKGWGDGKRATTKGKAHLVWYIYNIDRCRCTQTFFVVIIMYNSSFCSFDNNNGHWIRGICYWSLGRLCCGSMVKRWWYDIVNDGTVRPAVRKLYIPFRTQMFNSHLNKREMSWWKTHPNILRFVICDMWVIVCTQDSRHSSVDSQMEYFALAQKLTQTFFMCVPNIPIMDKYNTTKTQNIFVVFTIHM